LVPKLKCPTTVTEELALIDHKISDLKKRKGDFHCFCKNMLAKDGATKTKAYKFKGDKD